MDLICEKYRERVPEAEALCLRPGEYCKFRSACMIHFLGRERRSQLYKLNFSKGADGLLPAIVQDHQSGEVLMLAYINEESWKLTLESGKAHYWSRSRNKIWLKGESSGHVQLIKEIRVDCDDDTVVFKVEQLGAAACHTGHRTCFYRRLRPDGKELEVTETPVFDPAEVYHK